MMIPKKLSPVLAPVLLVFAALLGACANPGSGPDGGPYDEKPPQIVSLAPKLGQTNTMPKRITLAFDEYVTITDAQEKVIISPPQVEEPEIKVNGKKISVVLHDTLKRNTTYTVDFSDAIEDFNENNPMGNFTYFFSTGDSLDTMEVAGHVLQAADLAPMKGILVGLHSNLSDTAFRTLPFDRVARTDAQGRFCIKGVARKPYRIYALNDQDKDFKFSMKGEEIAFDTTIIHPSCYPDVRYDTLWADTTHFTAVTPVEYTHYQPDNIVLLAFREEGQMRGRLKEQRNEPESFSIYFSAPSDSTPQLKGVNFDETKLFVVRSQGNDTLTYWVADTALIKQDTLCFTLRYHANNDSTYLLETRLDTLWLVPKLTYSRRAKLQAEELEKWMKQRDKKRKRGIQTEEEPPRKYLEFKTKGASFSPVGNFHFSVPEPLARLDTAGIHLEQQINDSTRNPVRYVLITDSLNPLNFTIKAEWRPGQNYTLTIDSAAFVGVYGNHNLSYQNKISIGKTDSYGTLFVRLLNAPDNMLVQMCLDEKKVYKQTRAKNGLAEFYYLKAGKYYLRAFTDDNNDGIWTPGDYDEGRQAERFYYFNGEIEVRENWDIDQTWDVKALPLTQQKPEKLRKKESRKKTTTAERNLERLREKGKLQ